MKDLIRPGKGEVKQKTLKPKPYTLSFLFIHCRHPHPRLFWRDLESTNGQSEWRVLVKTRLT